MSSVVTTGSIPTAILQGRKAKGTAAPKKSTASLGKQAKAAKARGRGAGKG